MQRRIYIPVTRPTLMSLRAGTGVTGMPLVAFAVTDGLRRANPGADDEELEYLAFLQATEAATGAQRVVAAADVDADQLEDPAQGGPGPNTSAVRVSGPVPLRQMASFHLEEPRANGSQEGEFLWYDATEIETLVDLLA